ncbi:MAG TPA: phosphomethylpyrimidine synthase ThiC [Candidatus Brocadiia bacterium]|nr:phosphomethylpyrimidine synthase ThiC [Candidatus Brocadiia bacterium]
MTQLELARQGKITEAMEQVARDEGVAAEVIRQRIAAGRLVIPLNRRRKAQRVCGVGEGLRTKVNANIGASHDYPDADAELKKLTSAVDAGADAVMDLSTGGDITAIRQRILEASPIGVGTVPIYQAAVTAAREKGGIRQMTAKDMLDSVRLHCEQGVDFVTIHCGITRDVARLAKESERVCGVVSRGGAFLVDWVTHHKAENPFYQRFDEIIDMAKEFDVTLSLGDGMRPGAQADAFDRLQVEELSVMAGLCARAQAAGAQVMIEGPGHVPLNQVASHVQLQKALCKGAPFYVLGPIVTDVAPGYDHITSAIGGAIAAAAGADFLCYVTPAEHLGLPDPSHVRDGVIAARIAAHAADIAKGVPGAAEWDRKMSVLRRRRDWPGQLKLAMDPRRAAALRETRNVGNPETCSMCGQYCVFKVEDESGDGGKAKPECPKSKAKG